MAAATQQVTGLPDMKVSVRQVFGIDSDMEVPAYSEPDDHVPDVDQAVELYTSVLGFRQIDWNGHWMAFLNCNRDHHSLALVQSDGARLHHVAFEVHDWMDIARGIYHLGENHVPRVWGPGRHGPGNNVFSYFTDLDKNVIEYTCEVDQVDDSYVPRVWEPKEGELDYWCAYPPPPYMPR